jgi:hypothetical protein
VDAPQEANELPLSKEHADSADPVNVDVDVNMDADMRLM